MSLRVEGGQETYAHAKQLGHELFLVHGRNVFCLGRGRGRGRRGARDDAEGF